MKRKSIVIALLFISFAVYAETYFIDSEEVRTLRYLYNRQGLVFPIQSYPVHGSDLLKAAEKLPVPASEEDEELYNNLIAFFIHQRDSGFSIRGGLSASYEHRVRTSSVLADPAPEPRKNGIDFQRAYFSFDPILSLSAGGGKFTGLDIEFEAQLRQAWKDDYAPVNNFLYPFQGDSLDIGYEIVQRGMLSWNGNYIDAGLGREKVHFGNTPGATLYPSRLLPFMDGLRLTVAAGPFTMDYMLATIIPRQAKDEQPLKEDARASFGFMLDQNPSVILTSTHLFHWNFGKVKAGAGGTVVYARANNAFYFTDILPISIYHNADVRPNNLNLIFDVSWALYPGFTLSFMLGFDDINISFVNVGDSPIPTIPAAILQLEYDLRLKPFTVEFLFETGYTHYLWGNYGYSDDESNRWGGVYLARAIYRYSAFNYGVPLPLTSPYGPGTIWGRMLADFKFAALPLKTGVDLLFLSKARDANLTNTDYVQNDSIESSRLFYFSADIPCVYTWKWFDFKFIPAIIVRDGNAAFELTLGGQFKIDGTKRF